MMRKIEQLAATILGSQTEMAEACQYYSRTNHWKVTLIANDGGREVHMNES